MRPVCVHEAMRPRGSIIQKGKIGDRFFVVETTRRGFEALNARAPRGRCADSWKFLSRAAARIEAASSARSNDYKPTCDRAKGRCAFTRTAIMVRRSALFEGLPVPRIMLEHHRFVRWLKALVAAAPCAALLVPSVALAASKDKSATALDSKAMQTDYLAADFKKAEQALKKAVALCGGSGCSAQLEARLHRDLATVYIAGMKQAAKGKAELKLALAADPDVQLDNDLATPELRKAFVAAGGHDTKPVEEEKPAEAETPPEPEAEKDKEAPAEEAPASTAHKNWLSVHFEQDFLMYGSQDNVCASYGGTEAPNYSCFQSGSQFGYAPGQSIQPGVGNHIAAGLGRATSRLLIGFDRLVSPNISVGARIGFAFGGGPDNLQGAKFLPLHAEARANYWFGTDPFASSSLRPYLSLSAGVAEVDGHVLVEYYDANSQKGTLDAYRKAGTGFAGLGFGVMIPFAGSSGIVPELRALEMLGSSATAFDLSIGYALGF